MFCRRGSSPHVRGAPLAVCFLCVLSGIIPACAGSTRCATLFMEPPRDHPRMCGEHLPRKRRFGTNSGSSPHVRGAPVSYYSDSGGYGIIPACAGSTDCGPPVYCPPRDHPRMCGEHYPLTRSYATGSGSSPHVRGAHTKVTAEGLPFGIIPACAGSTRLRVRIPPRPRDHPRMCGEHTSKIA